MADLSKLVQQTVRRRKLNFYLLTEDEMSSLRSNTIVGDILFGLSMVFFGAAIAKSSITYTTLGVIFLLGSLHFYWLKASIIRRIKNEGEIEPTNTKQSSNSEVAPNQTVLTSAKYGANETWFDITDRVRAAVRAGGQIMVTNGLSGQDPLPGVPKFLRIHYVLNGEKFTKDYAEGTPLELPAEFYEV